VIKDIQGLLDDSFNAAKNEIADTNGKNRLSAYLNGMAVEEAVKSDSEIDSTAQKIAGAETDDREKAWLIYVWICRNIKYDYDKAVIIKYDPSKAISGAIETFNTRKGVCFDFSSLYVAMCRSVGLKVRLVTGYGYTGTAWVDHVWNQIYNTKNNYWINLDSTFGVSGINYFNNPYFGMDHRDGIVQGEW